MGTSFLQFLQNKLNGLLEEVVVILEVKLFRFFRIGGNFLFEFLI